MNSLYSSNHKKERKNEREKERKKESIKFVEEEMDDVGN